MAVDASRNSAPKVCRQRVVVKPVLASKATIEPLERRTLLSLALGIDVSHWDDTVNWTSVKGAGYTFAWAKATEGTGYFDDQFVANENNAKAAGVLIGAFISRAGTCIPTSPAPTARTPKPTISGAKSAPISKPAARIFSRCSTSKMSRSAASRIPRMNSASLKPPSLNGSMSGAMISSQKAQQSA